MIAADTSVVVAAFAPWHESHVAARDAVGSKCRLPFHCALESYSTLTRLPDPFRAPPDIAADFLRRRFGARWIYPTEGELVELPRRLATLGIVGGASYDALVAITALANRATVRTLDRRAERTYRLLGADYELLT